MTTVAAELFSFNLCLLGVRLKELCQKNPKNVLAEYGRKAYVKGLKYDHQTAKTLKEISDSDFARITLTSYRDYYCLSHYIEVFGSQLILIDRAPLTRNRKFYDSIYKIDVQTLTKGQKKFHSYILSLTDILSDRTLKPTHRIEKLCSQDYPCLSVLATQLTNQSLAYHAYTYSLEHKKEDVLMMISRLYPQIIKQAQTNYHAVIPPTVTTLVRAHSLETSENSNTLFENTASNSKLQKSKATSKDDRQEQMKLARDKILKARSSLQKNSPQ